MKVTLISQDFFPMKGGIARYLLGVYHKYFRQSQFEVLIPDSLTVEYQQLPFPVYPMPFKPFDFNNSARAAATAEIVEHLEKSCPDAVLIGYLRSHPEAALQYRTKHPDSKVVIFSHAKEVFLDSAIVRQPQTSMGSHLGYLPEEVVFYKKILKAVDYIFPVSHFTQSILERQGVKQKYVVVPPSIDTHQVTPEKEGDGTTILSVGRLVRRKGHHLVVDSLARLRESGLFVTYKIIGDGPERRGLEDQVHRLSLSSQVRFEGVVNDQLLQEAYRQADIFILPTIFIPPNDVEGFGIVFLEAALQGLPVIAGNSGGVPEAVVDGVTGYVIDALDPLHLDTIIGKLVEEPGLRRSLGAAGADRVRQNFTNSPDMTLVELLSGSC